MKKPTDIRDIYARAVVLGAERVYSDWADDYDADNARMGFRLPSLAAAFAARHIPQGAGPILDAGAGTGLVGAALKILGYPSITALDISPEMLGVAGQTGAYSSLLHHRLGAPLPFAENHFEASLCIGSRAN